jgi:cell division protein FtsA
MAIYIDGDVWHTAILSIGGNHISSDIAHGLRLPISQAEEIKLEHGHALHNEVDAHEYFNIRPFGEQETVQISRQELAQIIEARVEEIFSMVVQEIKRSGYDGLLPAGMVITGGTSNLPGIRNLASYVVGVPVRIAKPENLLGMTDKLDSPAFSTSVGLLKWATLFSEVNPQVGSRQRISIPSGSSNRYVDKMMSFLKRLLP